MISGKNLDSLCDSQRVKNWLLESRSKTASINRDGQLLVFPAPVIVESRIPTPNGFPMATEIERKFLVNTEALRQAIDTQAVVGERICQGYLTRDPERAVRIRVKGESGFITIKGASSADGTSRFEWEQEIPVRDAEQLIQLCLPTPIIKTRYEIQHEGHRWEVDIFAGENQGLILAEIELESADQTFALPAWVADEVTGIDRYYNAQLSCKPFRDWNS